MKKKLKIFVIIVSGLLVGVFLLSMLFFKAHLNEQPEITKASFSEFDFESAKPIFYSIGDKLYFHQKGKIEFNSAPILEEIVEAVFVSPNGKYAVLHADNELILIDHRGSRITKITNCTDLIPTGKDRKSGKFLGNNIQWEQGSRFFLLAQDRVWQGNFSDSNRTSIFKYDVQSNTLEVLLDLDDKATGDFYISRDNRNLYYCFVTDEGKFAYTKASIESGKIISTHHKRRRLEIDEIANDSIFINYRNYKRTFQGNSYDGKKIIVGPSSKLMYDDTDTTIILMEGKLGLNAFKGYRDRFFENGYFLPGNRYFIADIDAKNVRQTIIIDTKTMELMKTEKNVNFYFNVNNDDCSKFELRYKVVPRVRYATSVVNDINKKF